MPTQCEGKRPCGSTEEATHGCSSHFAASSASRFSAQISGACSSR
jgi:hypothetical protein